VDASHSQASPVEAQSKAPVPLVRVTKADIGAFQHEDLVLLYAANPNTPATDAPQSESDGGALFPLTLSHYKDAIQWAKKFDFSSLLENVTLPDNATDIAVVIQASQPQAGTMLALARDGVRVAFDGATGKIIVEGSQQEVAVFLSEVYFFANPHMLAHFTLDVRIMPPSQSGFSWISDAHAADSDALQEARILMLYEPESGFYVAQQMVGSQGIVPATSDLVNVQTPEGLSLFIHASQLDTDGMVNLFGGMSPSGSGLTPHAPPLTLEKQLLDTNAAPIANDDIANTTIQQSVMISGITDNDSDPDGDAIGVVAIDNLGANGGSLTDNGNGTYSYTPAAYFVGNDVFSYIISDGALTDTATITITIPEQTGLTASPTDILVALANNAAFSGIAAHWHATDTLYGAAGNDSLTITTGSANVDLDTSYINMLSIEHIELQGDGAHDIRVGDGYFDRAGGLQNDLFSVTTSSNVGVRLDASAIGDASHRVAWQTADGNDVLFGGAGNDTIRAGRGDDAIQAGAGDDQIILEAGASPSVGALVTNNLIVRIDPSVAGSVSASGGNVTNITDQATPLNNATGGAGAPQEDPATIHGLTAIRFDGDDRLHIANDAAINTNNQAARSIFMTFETGADINTTQVIYEQGGQTNGFNIYIANGQLYVGAWRDTGGTFDIFHSAAIAANTSYSAGLVFDHVSGNSFTGYLNGNPIGSVALGADQSAHTGGIGIGGVNQDTRLHTGGFAGSGLGFTGRVGELLNYDAALNATERADVQAYLNVKWGIVGGASDSVHGGSGHDTLEITGSNAFSEQLSATSATQSIEVIDLSGADAAHTIQVNDGYYTSLDSNLLTVTAAGNNTGMQLSAFVTNPANQLHITGGNGNDTLTAGAGNDIFVASAGDDTLQGGEGVDRVDYSNSNSAVHVDMPAGTATGFGNDNLSQIEHVIGSAFHDTITGGQGGETLSGGAGNDIITGGETRISTGIEMGNLVARLDASNLASITTSAGAVTAIYDQSSRNNDAVNDGGTVISGSATINGLNALQFNGSAHLAIADTGDINLSGTSQYSALVSFETGADISSRQVIYEQGGGTNGFNIYIENGNLYVGAWRGGGGTFELFAHTTIDANTVYTAGFVFDSVATQTFTGYLDGVSFDSITNATAQLAHGGDIGIGGINNASYFDGTGGDGSGSGYQFTGTIGELLLYNDALTASELANTNNFLLNKWQPAGSDLLQGDAGDDQLRGSLADDRLEGGSGNDTLTGGGGADSITGGSGNDLFSFEAIGDSGIGATARDVITDFTTAQDRIDLSAIGGLSVVSANSAGNGVADFTGMANQLAWQQIGADMLIYIDQDGDAIADAEIQLSNTNSLQASDFVF
jgi:Ca2+-binding RTX toxin-like protein